MKSNKCKQFRKGSRIRKLNKKPKKSKDWKWEL